MCIRDSSKTPQLDQKSWQHKLAGLPQNAQGTLRQALATVAAKSPSAKVDEAMLLRLAEDLAIKFAMDRYQRGEVQVNAVRQMPVSYTHLDVYKRQGIGHRALRKTWGPGQSQVFLTFCTDKLVPNRAQQF